jgi:formylglycine-generating enzyme required for sulfatase activity
VTLGRPFAIGRAEVTAAEWDACARAGACESKIDDEKRPPNHPQDYVSWDMVQVYLGWISERTGHVYRLPSEAEWEYAARGGTATTYWWGDGFKKDHANCRVCGRGLDRTARAATPAGAYPANPFGLYDILGNLSEWVADCWNPTYDGAPVDGSAWITGNCRLRIIRGGSRFSWPYTIQSFYRYRIFTKSSGNDMGFRVVRELP